MATLRHVQILDPMRGIAALAVVLFHYSGSILPTLIPNPANAIFSFGYLGVQVFFVISGFVIPYALQRSRYNWNDLGRFMARRFIRIAPPAYVAALFMIAYYYLSIVVNGHPVAGNEIPALGFRSILANLTFTVPYLHVNWFNFVYWTLTTEFEFYLMIALLFPFIADRSPGWRVALVLSALVLLPFFKGPVFFPYSGYFLLGMLVFLWRETGTDRRLLASIFVLASIQVATHRGYLELGASILAVAVIMAAPKARSRATDWLGKVSYTLYIIHVPVGYFAEALLKRFIGPDLGTWGKMAMLLVYTGIALVLAEPFYRLVERPFLTLSKRIRRNDRLKEAA